ncbi:MAG: PKD domain-containing protein, partial [Verrucomicrobiales bacterium]|nr:PKD domain-containing protein [Verrucomicrobiales bacterium]
MKFSSVLGSFVVVLGLAIWVSWRSGMVPQPLPTRPTDTPAPEVATVPAASRVSGGEPSEARLVPDAAVSTAGRAAAVRPAGRTGSVLPTTPFAAFDAWLARYDSSRGAGADGLMALEAEGVRLASRRRDEFEDLIEADPRRALESALPDAVRAGLPPAVAALVEERVAGRGDFEVLCALAEDGREGEVRPLQRYAVIGERRFRAFVYGERLRQPTLRDVSLHGVALGRSLALHESPIRELPPAEAEAVIAAEPRVPCAEGENHPAANPLARVLEAYGRPVALCCSEHATRFEARLAAAGTGTTGTGETTPPTAASPATSGSKRILFIRVDFSDLQGESLTTSRAADLARELHSFFQNNSYGRAGFREIGAGSDVTPVFRMPRTAASYGSNDDAGDLRTDARNAARNAGYVLGNYDYDITCMKSVPGFGWAGLGFVGAPGAWIRGTSSTGVTAHELGHNYGLNHANYWDTAGPTVTGRGESIEYGDKFDTMGAASAGNNHFNARYKRLLGWLQDGEFAVATTNGTYRVHAHDVTNAVVGSRGLQIFANARTNYWVEFRQRFSSNRWLFNGVGLRWTGRGNEASLLLDTTPDSPREKDDAAITLGRTFSDFDSGIHVTPIAKGGSTPAWIDVVVRRGRFPENRPPTLRLVAPVTEGSTSTSFEFETDARDADGDPLAFFWEFGDESLGTNAPTQTHRWSSTGEFVVHCTASDMRGGIARAFAVVRVGAPSTLRISGRVTADGEPVVGARVAATSERFGFTDS